MLCNLINGTLIISFESLFIFLSVYMNLFMRFHSLTKTYRRDIEENQKRFTEDIKSS